MMATFKTKPEKVEVEKILGLRQRPWKVRYPDGKILYFTDEAFIRCFEPADMEADEFLEEHGPAGSVK